MQIFDISVTITPQLVTWADSETNIVRVWNARMDQGAVCNGSTVTLGSHCGTHLDAPLHFIGDGDSVERLDLSRLIGPCQVVEIEDLDHPSLARADLDTAGIRDGATRVLFKTSNSRKKLLRQPKFDNKFVGIGPDAARWLVERGIVTVGVDYLSVGSACDGTGAETHRILLGAKIAALEGLLLDDIAPGEYNLIALPLKIDGAEGCPMRAVLTRP